MSSAEVSEVFNWSRLRYLVDHSCICLRRLFKRRYQEFFNQVWDDSSTLGTNLHQTISKNRSKFQFLKNQSIAIRHGNSEDWDLSILTALLLNIPRPSHLSPGDIKLLDQEDQLLEDVRNIRNEIYHHATRRISDKDFDQSWQKLKSILIGFGDDDSVLDKLKDDIELKSSKEIVDPKSMKEMNDLNTQGNRSYREQNYSDAIKYFTKAITLPHLSSEDRARLYSNRSRTRLALYEQLRENNAVPSIPTNIDIQRYHALEDAKQARNLWPRWWKAHYRVGNAYSSMNEHEKAIDSFKRALAQEPCNDEVKRALDASRWKKREQERYEHFDPRSKPQTIDENLSEMERTLGISPESVRRGHLLAEKSDDHVIDCVIKGHKYFHGDPTMGVEQDYEQAAKYFAEAARQGNAEGMYNLGMLYDRGHGVEKNHSLATQLYEEAATQPAQLPNSNRPNIGVAEAQHSLGLRYNNGIDVSQNFAIAAAWYERAAKNGCEHAANNLAILYRDGTGVKQDHDKAKQWFEFAAERGDSNAMRTLCHLSLEASDFEMARKWLQRACDAGHLLTLVDRDDILALIYQQQVFTSQLPQSLVSVRDAFKKVTDLYHIEPKASVSSRIIYDYKQLQEYASNGSVTAKQLCCALDHYHMAMKIIKESKNTDENRFIYGLAVAYRIEQRVVEIPDENLYKLQTWIRTALKIKSDDIDTQICYVYLRPDEFEQNGQLLNEWKSKNPNSIDLYIISADTNCFLQKYADALLDCNTGLQLDPNNCDLLYTKAVASRLLHDIDRHDVILAYEKFLSVAPKDHRKVPESYYAITHSYLSNEYVVVLADK